MEAVSFINDSEKMRDFRELKKEEFLKSYSYLTEEEYQKTREELGYPDICDRLEWSIYEEYYDKDKSWCVELSKYSPEGEDFVMSFWYDGTLKDFAYEVREYYEYFDAEDHAAMWYEAKQRAASGVPGLKALVQDAEDIEKMIDELATALEDELWRRKNEQL